jgi:N,N'-diacetyllegionaminate synthase
MGRTLVIAELGSSWRFGDDHLANAYRLIEAAKECGADVAKFQWTSDPFGVAKRRGLDEPAAAMYAKYLAWDRAFMERLKAKCDEVGIEWACTIYLPQDIPVIAPLVKRFKVSNYESTWLEFVDAHFPYNKQVIISKPVSVTHERDQLENVRTLQCVSQYPCPILETRIAVVRGSLYTKYGRRATWLPNCDGLSDHTTSTLTGALAVAAGATIVEKHIKLCDTPGDNPDFPHSLNADCHAGCEGVRCFQTYVDYIRQAERAL